MPTSGYRLVVFDLDGTLVDSAEDLATAVNSALKSHDLTELPRATIVGFIGNGAARLVGRSVRSVRPDASDEDVGEALRAFLEYYRQHCLDRTRLYPGVGDALRELRAQGRALAVLTNKPRDFTEAILSGLGVREQFAGVVGGDDLPTRKPDPAGLLALAGELGCRPEHVLLVGDSDVDIATGANAGVATCGVTWGFGSEDELRTAGATRVVRQPAEIVEIAQ